MVIRPGRNVGDARDDGSMARESGVDERVGVEGRKGNNTEGESPSGTKGSPKRSHGEESGQSVSAGRKRRKRGSKNSKGDAGETS